MNTPALLPATAACAAALLLAGCGHSSPTKHAAARPKKPSTPPVCLPKSLDAMAGILAVRPAAITTSVSTGNNAMPQCSYVASTSGGGHVGVLANVDNGPSAYFVLERTIVEASQVFGAQRLSPAPVAVFNLGLEASWFPAHSWLMSTDGYRIITATVTWPRAKQSRDIALARAVTVPYLHTPHGKAAEAVVNGYPSSG
jgi:hypothetical protein